MSRDAIVYLDWLCAGVRCTRYRSIPCTDMKIVKLVWGWEVRSQCAANSPRERLVIDSNFENGDHLAVTFQHL